VVDYRFEEMQYFKIAVYDLDDKVNMDDLEMHNFLGEAEFKLSNVVTAGKVLTKQLIKDTDTGKSIACILQEVLIKFDDLVEVNFLVLTSVLFLGIVSIQHVAKFFSFNSH